MYLHRFYYKINRKKAKNTRLRKAAGLATKERKLTNLSTTAGSPVQGLAPRVNAAATLMRSSRFFDVDVDNDVRVVHGTKQPQSGLIQNCGFWIHEMERHGHDHAAAVSVVYLTSVQNQAAEIKI